MKSTTLLLIFLVIMAIANAVFAEDQRTPQPNPPAERVKGRIISLDDGTMVFRERYSGKERTLTIAPENQAEGLSYQPGNNVEVQLKPGTDIVDGIKHTSHRKRRGNKPVQQNQ